MKLLIISHEFPYPVTQGGRYDIWNRILAFKKAGVEIYLISWYEITKNDLPAQEDISYVESVVDHLLLLRISRDYRRVLNLLIYPSGVAARIINNCQYKEIHNKILKFGANCIWVETVYPTLLAYRLCDDLHLPVYIRQHNIEYKYIAGQFMLAKRIKLKLALLASSLHLKNFEIASLSRATRFFDISLNDLEFWREMGYKNGQWFPPITFASLPITTRDHTKKEYNIGFVGNLYAPNNVKGVFWFVNNVLPLIWNIRPNTTFLLAGSNPNQAIINLCESDGRYTLCPNPLQLDQLYGLIDVLINPVQFGSGINIKTIDMIFRNNPVVSTSVGVQGLPQEINRVFTVTDCPNSFAHAVIREIDSPTTQSLNEKALYQKMFHFTRINELLEIIFPSK